MPRTLSKDDIVTAILNGVTNSFTNYKKWAEEFLCEAPEYLITCEIARALYNQSSKKGIKVYVTLEDNLRYLLRESGVNHRGRFKKGIDPKSRCDVILWNAGLKPRAIIEVKRGWSLDKNCKNDIIRLANMLRKSSLVKKKSLKYGYFVFYTDHDKEDIDLLRRRYSDFTKKAGELVGEDITLTCNENHQLKPKLDNGSTWGGLCMALSKSG